MGAGFALIVGVLQRRVNLTMLKRVFIETAYTSVALYTVLFGALMFAKLVAFSGFAEAILTSIEATGVTGVLLIVMILLVFLVLGCVMDSLAIILICVPLFSPVIVAQGYDLTWFGILVVVATEIARITPPIGMNVFVLRATLPQVPIRTIYRGLVPFIAADVVRLALLVAFPAISLILPRLMN